MTRYAQVVKWENQFHWPLSITTVKAHTGCAHKGSIVDQTLACKRIRDGKLTRSFRTFLGMFHPSQSQSQQPDLQD